jgi:hypothetical protein
MLSALRLSFNAVALLGLLVLAGALGHAHFGRLDTPWEQLVLGKQLAEAKSIPKAEGILFTAAPHTPFDGRSWVWDLAAWETGSAAGAGALKTAEWGLWVLAIWALAAASFRRGARPFSTALFCAWALAAALPDLVPGPSLAGFTVFCVGLWIVEGDFWPAFFGRWIWLAPLAVLAVNLSPAAWALLPLALGSALDGRPGVGAPARPALAKFLFLAVLGGCLCLHPQGISGTLLSLRHLAPSPLSPGAFAPRQWGLLFLATAGALAVASGWTAAGKERLGRDAAVLAAFGAAALYSREALSYCLAAAAPTAAARFDALVDALPALLRALRWPAKVAVLGGAAAFAWTAGVFARTPAKESSTLPSTTVTFYGNQLLDVDVLCPREWTPFLAWKLSPNARFALDARGVAEPGRTAVLEAALRGDGDIAGALSQQGVELCWLRRGSPAALALASSQAWQPVAYDDASVLYVPCVPQNADLIRDHAPRGLRPGDPGEPFDPTRLVQAEADLESGLAQDPGQGVVYLYLARLWSAKGYDAKSRQTLEAGVRADPNFAENYAQLAQERAALGGEDNLVAARLLYDRALALKDEPAWREARVKLEGVK